MYDHRYLEHPIDDICFAANKMAFVSGPRQCGKTTMAKRLLKERGVGSYYNWDETKFRRQWTKDPSLILSPLESTHKKPLLILDELHKAKLWKRTLKGIYDSQDKQYDILVTGSARLNIYRKGSDSLLGRYYHFRLHPFSLAELLKQHTEVLPKKLIQSLFAGDFSLAKNSQNLLDQLIQFGPFPEPLFAAKEQTLNLWRRNRIEKIIREDLRDLSRLPELSQVEMLASLLPERVGSPLSIKSLSEDLEVAYTTIKRWLGYLNELYYFFNVKPYATSLARAIKKENKLYLWDWSEVNEPANRFENLVASHLLKYCHYLTDTGYGEYELRYLRNKEKFEIDFLLLQNKKPWLPVEVKLNDGEPSKNWLAFMKQLGLTHGIQVVYKPGVFELKEFNSYKILIISAADFLQFLI
jgi:hypothetical protein